MKPVKMDDFSQGRVTQETLLLLNITTLRNQYATRLLTRRDTNTSIRSKGGIMMPNETWAMILDFVLGGKKAIKGKDDVEGVGSEDRICLVKANLVVESSNTMLLRCFRHEFDNPDDAVLAGNLESLESVRDFARYLACATPSTLETLKIELPELRRLSGPNDVFNVILDTTSTDFSLYTFCDVPDFIATMDGGGCYVCRGERFICPGCTGGIAQKFDAFMGCGVDLACPLCMGLRFSGIHRAFLQEYYWDKPSKYKAKEMREDLEDRLDELGYGEICVREGAWGKLELHTDSEPDPGSVPDSEPDSDPGSGQGSDHDYDHDSDHDSNPDSGSGSGSSAD
ncbi:hypothetical protein F5Y04DRAFT_281689 [Hypomontagnella monticulosa]|nr:hypothetical protein F5Y04DRAFT_281689 [Hypomontagnella monticulosa]